MSACVRWGDATDLLVSVNDNIHPGVTAQNIKHASIGDKANTDNNVITFDKHLPGKILDVNVGVLSNETEPIEARVTNKNVRVATPRLPQTTRTH